MEYYHWLGADAENYQSLEDFTAYLLDLALKDGLRKQIIAARHYG